MQYVLVHFDRAGDAYQEIKNGDVVRYLDSLGIELFIDPPLGDGVQIVDANPRGKVWMNITPAPLSNVVLTQALSECSSEQLTVELARR